MNTCTIIGILNTTPDSYHDGGKFNGIQTAVRRAGEMLQEGVDIIEVGGESTGPGSTDVSVDEELQRTIPIIQAIQKEYPESRIGIDTYKSQVATEACNAGASMVNDVTAGRGDPNMFRVVAEHDVFYAMMYSKDHTPRTTIQEQEFSDVVDVIHTFLRTQKDAAIRDGIKEDKIIVDPGMGHFVSSNPSYSFEVITRLQEFKNLNSPILLSPSRKSFLAGVNKYPSSERLEGTIAAAAIAIFNGADYIRTHDITALKKASEIAVECRNKTK